MRVNVRTTTICGSGLQNLNSINSTMGIKLISYYRCCIQMADLLNRAGGVGHGIVYKLLALRILNRNLACGGKKIEKTITILM